MGLDMFAFKAKVSPSKQFDDIFEGIVESSINSEELFYWRKHPNLHGWMEELYIEKGGNCDPFNGTQLVLTTEDLDKLETAIKNGELPNTNGFFFGKSSSDEEEMHEDLRFVAEARNSISEGYTVWYDSWW